MDRLMNTLLVTLLLNTLHFHPLLSFLSPASAQEQNERGQGVLATTKEIDSENITNQSHKDTCNSCPEVINLQIVSSVRCDFLHISKKLILKQEK